MNIATLSDFDALLVIAKKHGVAHLRVGDIEVALPGIVPEMEKQPLVTSSSPQVRDLDAEAYVTYSNM